MSDVTMLQVRRTPPFDQVFLKAWKQCQFSEHIDLLQQAIDNPGVDAAHIETCMRTHEKYFNMLPAFPADGTTWHGLFKFRMRSGAVVGVLVAPKVSDFASLRHCAVFVEEGAEALDLLELNTLLRDLGAEIEE